MLELLLALVDPKDEAKITILYKTYCEQMYYKASQILHSHHDCEEAIQKAFIGIAKNINSIDDPLDDRSRVYCIKAAKNHAINQMSANEKEAFPIGEHQFILDERAIADYLDQNRENVVDEAMQKLPELYRDILYYRYYEDMSIKEICVLLGRTEGTVKIQIHRGLEKMRKLLTKDDLK